MHLSTYLLLILIQSILSSVAQSFQTSRTSKRQRSAFEKLQQNQCSYGGGTINNSTVIQLGNCFNDIYYIGLNIGTQGQYFNFQFDTGSPTLWIPLGTNPTGFNQTASSTYSTTNIPKQIKYGGGNEVFGNMGYDVVSINQTPITTNYSILFATFSNSTFGNTNIYGLVGMDYKSYPNFLDLAYQKGQISTPVFSLQLRNQNETSILYYNDGLPQAVKQNIVWVSMLGPAQFWQLQLLSFSINGINLENIAADIVVIDSGTSLIALNQDLYNSIVLLYFSGPNCQQDYRAILCKCDSTWPELAFMLNGIQVYVPGTAINKNIANGYCELLIQPTSEYQIILGDVFFREYTITFDRPNLRIGFSGAFNPVQTYNPHYFFIIEYVMCGAQIILGVLGIGLLIYSRSAFKKILQSTLSTELTKY